MTRTGATIAVVTAVMVVAVLVGGLGVGFVGAEQDDCTFPVETTDGGGVDVIVAEEPGEIVVLGPSTAQYMWELDAAERVTGMPVNQYTEYLDGHDEREHVVDQMGVPDAEKVIDLDPDLVLAPAVVDEDSVEQLRDAGLTVYQAPTAESIDDVREQTRTYGELVGNCEEAEETVEWMDDKLDAVETVEERPTVFYWMPGGFTAGEGTFQHELIEAAGGENAAANMGIEDWQQIDEERLVEENPEYLLLEEGIDVPDSAAVQSTQAVENDRIVRVDANEFNQPAPRTVLAVESIAEQLEPVAEEGTTDEEPSTEEDDAASDETTDQDVTTTSDGAEPTANDDAGADELPGFGVAVAVLGLLGGIVALRGRNKY